MIKYMIDQYPKSLFLAIYLCERLCDCVHLRGPDFATDFLLDKGFFIKTSVTGTSWSQKGNESDLS